MNLTGYFAESVLWFLVFSPATGLVTTIVSVRRSRGRPRREVVRIASADLLVAITVLGVLCITLLPRPPYEPGYTWGVQLVPLASIIATVTEPISTSVALRIVGMNVALFVPLGAALMLRVGRWRRAVLTAAVMSVAVELLQLALPLGRTANIDDVILNSAGAMIGATVVAVLRRRR